MAAYDPKKREWWVVGSSGFWRRGEVNKTEHMAHVFCTWADVKAIMERMAAHSRRFYELKNALGETEREERKAMFATLALLTDGEA